MIGRFALCCLLASASLLVADDSAAPATTVGDRLIAEYFRHETARLTRDSLSEIKTREDWEEARGEYRRQLFSMLGLDPLPEKTPLNPVITGKLEHDDFTVENLHFQSRPGLYVTGNLYVPKNLDGPAPTILYVCGHARVKEGDVSFGNKTAYQHHGEWFARHGYVCLTIDTIQLGEIEGVHHGTYSQGKWDWHARGYTPAGVEAWNCIRALDYLETRPEVDKEKFGVTGRSGGGAYSWWIAALDDRIQAAVPVAGITSLQNHVVDDAIEGHCDCMFMVNTYEWDFPILSALVAPRPLLISNTDKDRIFPLDGVYDVYVKTRRIYDLYDATGKLGLQITEGPHKDTQELRIHAFVWFDRFLQGETRDVDAPGVKLYEPAELKVFEELPADERVTDVHDWFVPVAEAPPVPQSQGEWESLQGEWLERLKNETFRGWPEDGEAPQAEQVFSETRDGVRLETHAFNSQQPYELKLHVARPEGTELADLDLIVLNVLDQQGWEEFVRQMRVGFPHEFGDETVQGRDEQGWRETQEMFQKFKWGMAWLAPRGVGLTEWTRNEKERTQILRRFALIGQTADGMRVWDVRRGIQALRSIEGAGKPKLWLQGNRDAALWAVYASLFEPDVARLDLWGMASSHTQSPIFLNVLRILDVPQALALAAARSKVILYQEGGSEGAIAEFAQQAARKLGWDGGIEVRKAPGPEATTEEAAGRE